MAEAYLRSRQLPDVTVLSAGTVAGQHRQENIPNFARTVRFLESRQVAEHAKDHHADDLTEELLADADIVVCLNDRVYKELQASFTPPAKTLVWDVSDIGEGTRIAADEAEKMALSEEVYDEIVDYVDALVEQLND